MKSQFNVSFLQFLSKFTEEELSKLDSEQALERLWKEKKEKERKELEVLRVMNAMKFSR